MEKIRCSWCGDDQTYVNYHDREWGRPLHDEKRHFEMLLLETFQSGLSWITILRKRENFRAAFSQFNPGAIAAYSDSDIERLMADPGIIRNRRKIEGAIKNARLFLDIQKEWGSFDSYIWHFTDGKVVDGNYPNQDLIPTRSELSDKVTANLKKRGFSYVGSVTVYSHLEAIGVLNNHIADCFVRNEMASPDV